MAQKSQIRRDQWSRRVSERLEKFKRRLDAAEAPLRNILDELREEADALLADMQTEPPAEATDGH